MCIKKYNCKSLTRFISTFFFCGTQDVNREYQATMVAHQANDQDYPLRVLKMSKTYRKGVCCNSDQDQRALDLLTVCMCVWACVHRVHVSVLVRARVEAFKDLSKGHLLQFRISARLTF